MGSVGEIFATLGLRVNEAQWSKGDAAMANAKRRADGLFQDAAGRWRQATGQFVNATDRASLGLANVGNAAAKAGKQGSEAFDGMGTAIKAYLTYLGGHAAYERLIKFNQNVQDAKISLSAMLQGNLGGDWATATKNASDLYEEFQRFSQTTPVTTQQMLEFGRGVAVATFQAGGSIKDLTTITEMGTVAAKTLGAESNYAALELTEMLQGNVSKRMRFAQQLLGMAHVTSERFREMSAKERLSLVTGVLTSPAMKNANDAMAASFSGVTSTLEDKLQIVFGKIGKPLFDAITGAVKNFNHWLDTNAEKIEAVGKVIGDGLVVAFHMLGSALELVSDAGKIVIDVLGQWLDKGELLSAFLIALGSVITAFAVRAVAAWIASAGPIVLVIAAVTALVYAVRWLMSHPDKVRKAFVTAFEAIQHAARVVWEAIKTGFRAAFDFIVELPVVRHLIWLVERLLQLRGGSNNMDSAGNNPAHKGMTPAEIDKLPENQLNYVEQMKRLSNPEQFLGPQASLGRSKNVTIGSVDVGGITVTSPNANPTAVAAEMHKVFEQKFSDKLREALDVV